MKMIFVGVFGKNSTNISQARSFEQCKVNVVRYDYRRWGTELGPLQRDAALIKLCKDVRPDFIFFSKCDELTPQVFEECHKVTKTVLWYMDPALERGKYFFKNMAQCDLVCCALWAPYQAFKKRHPHVFQLCEGFDPAVDSPAKADTKHDVSFIGHLNNLSREKYHAAVGFHIYTQAYGRTHAVAVAESRINLNFTEGGTSDRAYKVLAARGFLLTEAWPHMTDIFKPGRDLAVFTDIKTLRAQIKYYLTHPAERAKIAKTGCKTVQRFKRSAFAQRVLALVCAVKKGKA